MPTNGYYTPKRMSKEQARAAKYVGAIFSMLNKANRKR